MLYKGGGGGRQVCVDGRVIGRVSECVEGVRGVSVCVGGGWGGGLSVCRWVIVYVGRWMVDWV